MQFQTTEYKERWTHCTSFSTRRREKLSCSKWRIKYPLQRRSERRHGAAAVALNDEGLQACKRSDFVFYVVERAVVAEIGWGEMFPELDGGGFFHVEGLADEVFAVQFATQIHHGHIEEGIAIAEVAQVDEIALVANEDGVGEL